MKRVAILGAGGMGTALAVLFSRSARTVQVWARDPLHAAELAMPHPLTREPLRVLAPPPDDFQQAAEERKIVSRGEDILTAAECG